MTGSKLERNVVPPEQRMKEAAGQLTKVTKMIKGEHLGQIISMPIIDAALVFRISPATFCAMEERRQELVISARKDKVFIKLRSEEGQRVDDYNFLYGFIQSIRDGSEQQYLTDRTIPQSLLEQFPGLKEDLIMAKKGKGGFEDEDLRLLHFRLYALWFSVRHRDVENWENVL